MQSISKENIQKLMDLGFEENEVLKALALKKNLSLAARWLYSQKVPESDSDELKIEYDSNSNKPFKPIRIDDQNTNENYYEGQLKFLDDEKMFGFINFGSSDIFFHYSDKKDPSESFFVGNDVLFKFGENQNPGKNLGRSCAKEVKLKNALNSSNSPKRTGVIVEIRDKCGFVQDYKQNRTYIFYLEEIPPDSHLSVGDRVLFFLEIKKHNGIVTTNATQIELIKAVENYKLMPFKGPTADLSKNFFFRHDVYPADESRSVEFKALTKTGNVVQRVIELTEKYLVAFLNAEGGRILFGILDNGHILGLKLDRRTRDEIRLRIDSLVAQILPAVPNYLYKVVFYPVLERRGCIDDYYVLCVECKRGTDIYADSKHNAWIRRDGSVRIMNISMAKILWHNRLEEKEKGRSLGGTSSSDLRELIKSAVSSELRKVVSAANPSINNFNKEHAIKPKTGQAGYSSSSPICISDIDSPEECSGKSERMKDEINLIDLDSLKGFDIKQSLNTSPSSLNMNLRGKDKKFKKTEDKIMEDKTGKNKIEVMKENGDNNIAQINQDLVNRLMVENYTLPEVLEALYLQNVTNDKSKNENAESLFEKARAKLEANKREKLEEDKNSFKDNEVEIEKIVEKTIKSIEFKNKKQPPLESERDVFDTENLFEANNFPDDFQSEFNTKNTKITKITKIETKNKNKKTESDFKVTKDFRDEVIELFDSDGSDGKQKHGENYKFKSKDSDGKNNKNGVEADIEEMEDENFNYNYNLNNGGDFGLFSYMNSHDYYARKARGISDREVKKKSKGKSKFEKKIEDAANNTGYEFTEKHLFDINELVYPVLSELFSKKGGFKIVLKDFLLFNLKNSFENHVSLPNYETNFKKNNYVCLLRFKFAKKDYFFTSDGSKNINVVEEIAAKKALCVLEDKGLFFRFDEDKGELERTESERSEKMEFEEGFDDLGVVCEVCGITVPKEALEKHSRDCGDFKKKQEREFLFYNKLRK